MLEKGFNDCLIRKFCDKNYLTGKCTHFRVPANPEEGFNFEYVLIVPELVKKNTKLILEEMNYSTEKHFTEEEGIEYLYEKSKSFRHPIHYCNSDTNYCILLPLIPRYYDSKLNLEIYTNQLSSLCFSKEIKEKYYRIDIQITAMINDATKRMALNNISIAKKIIIEGFSASGKFANRFTLLHPEYVELCIAGGLAGTLILPFRKLGGKDLVYPVGISNIDDITEKKIAQFKKVKHFYYFNLKDNVDCFCQVGGEPYYKGIILKSEMLLLYDILGISPEIRWQNSKKFYSSCENVIFKEYNEAHNYNLEIMNDIKNLLNSL